jgi:DNA-binding beta-propeller fold protein YncE
VLIDPRGRIAGDISGEIQASDFASEIQEVINQHADEIDRTPLDLASELPAEPKRLLRFPSRLLIADDTLFIVDSGHNRIIQVRMDEGGLSGEVEQVIGSGEASLVDGPAESAAFHHPRGLGLVGSPSTGTLYVADTENHAIRSVDLSSGTVTTLAGTGQKAHGRYALGTPTEMPLRSPWAVLPVEDFLLIAMAGSHQIWVYLAEKQNIGPFAGNGSEALVDGPVAKSSFNQPSDLAFGMGHLFVADPEASAIRAIALSEPAQTVTLVGQGLFEFGDQDGTTAEALLQHPLGLDFSAGALYLVDTYNNKIKLLDPVGGKVQTLAGDGQPGWKDGSFETARFYEPEGLQVVGERIYIADTNNHLVRVADLKTRQVRTFRLHGIERLRSISGTQEKPEMLPAIDVAPGAVRFVLEVRLPSGYQRNPDAPVQLAVGEQDDQKIFSYEQRDEIQWEMRIDTDREVTLDLSIYYCQEKEAALCLIHNRKLVLPVRVAPGKPAQVRIPYSITLPGAVHGRV